jgi:hypothetical protein
MKTHWNSSNLTPIESILLLCNLRRLKLKPFLTEKASSRFRDRMLRKFGVDIEGPPDKVAYELLSCRGGDLELWPSPREIERAA